MHAYVFSVSVYAYTSISMQKYIHVYVSTLIKEEVTNLGVIGVAGMDKDGRRGVDSVLMYEIKQNSSMKNRRKKLNTMVFLVVCPHCSG